MSNTQSASNLKAERVCARNHVFNFLLVLVMKVSFLTYFVITPWMGQIAKDLSVSSQVMTLVAVVYEVGKMIGTIFIGRFANDGNVLRCILSSMWMFVAIALLLTFYLESGWRTHSAFDFVIFAMLYLPLSVVCIGAQFGLSVLQKTNSELRCKRYIMLQGLLACVLQGGALIAGEEAGELLGWEAEFLCLAAFVAFVALSIYLSATAQHFEACEAVGPLKHEEQRASYWSTTGTLIFGAQNRRFQVFMVALGVATANMYLLPMYGEMLLTGNELSALSPASAAYAVGATFIANFLCRALALLLAHRVEEVYFVNVGVPVLFIGSLLLYVLVSLPSGFAPTFPTTFVASGLVIQMGVGFVMPNCKSGMLTEVDKSSKVVANSLIKLSQLIFTAIAQLVATMVGSSADPQRFALMLLCWNGSCVIGLIMWRLSQSDVKHDVEHGVISQPVEVSEKLSSPQALAITSLQSVRCLLMRAGTSRGPFLMESDLPRQGAELDQMLCAMIGSAASKQIDGLGGGTSVSSKVAILAPSRRPSVDVDYTFAQVHGSSVKWGANCGNMLSGVGPAAILRGLVPAQNGSTTVRVFNTNTATCADVVVSTPGGALTFAGDTVIDGVPGTGAPIHVSFKDLLGPRTGRAFPTSSHWDTIDGVRVTCIDSCNPIVLVDARQFADMRAARNCSHGLFHGLHTGHEDPATLNADTVMLEMLENIRLKAALLMGLGDATGQTIPKVCLLSPAVKGGTICSRYFVPDTCHNSHAITGAVAVAVSTTFEGTVAHSLACSDGASARNENHTVTVEHPAGKIDINLQVGVDGCITGANLTRTASVIMDGHVFVPPKL